MGTLSLRRNVKSLTLLIAISLLFFFAYLRYSKKATHDASTLDIAKMVPFKEAEPVVTHGGLATEGKQFYLAEKQFRILSGSVHYFRVVPEYWRDRLIKLKAMGLNTVDTYVPWNLHEETKGQFTFDGNLDLRAFIRIAQELGLYVIVRPGPYICSEWDFGGLPSWLLHDPAMQPRTMYQPYIFAVERYFSKLLPLLVPLQFSNGGPIIAFQIENEYGSFDLADVRHMTFLKSLMIREKLTELLFTSDNIHGIQKYYLSLPNVLKTINFGGGASVSERFKLLDKEKPVMVAEYWIGWFDHWHSTHHVVDPEDVAESLIQILKLQGSVNLYMFHGGTNFGFMNGANSLSPTTTSYDYDAALSEAGDITPKYKALRNVIKQYTQIPNDLPAVPENSPKEAYGKVVIGQHMSLEELLQYHIPFESENDLTMEQLPINNFGGQGYGFTLYQSDLTRLPKEILIETVLDRAQVFVNSVLIHVSDVSLSKELPKTEWMVKIKVDNPALSKAEKYILEILVENMGRTNINWNMRLQRKGIQGRVMVDGQRQTGWKIVPLEFKADVLSRLSEKENWNVLPGELLEGPSLYRGTFQVNSEPRDTFLLMEGWTKGVCFINGHNLGRYWNVGPQMTLYVPGPWLRKGENYVIIFELHQFKAAEVSFVNSPVLQG